LRATLVAVLVLCAAPVRAETFAFDAFKFVSETPAVHSNRDLHKPIEPLRVQVASCGAPIVDSRLKRGAPIVMKLHIDADGGIGEVTLDTKLLAEDTVECIAKIMRGVKYPPRKKPSVLAIALMYRRVATAPKP
jgi:hypothetical protein